MASVVAMPSLNYLKLQLRLFSIVEKRFPKLPQLCIVSLQLVESGFRSSISDYFVVAVKSRHVEFVALYKKFDSVPWVTACWGLRIKYYRNTTGWGTKVCGGGKPIYPLGIHCLKKYAILIIFFDFLLMNNHSFM